MFRGSVMLPSSPPSGWSSSCRRHFYCPSDRQLRRSDRGQGHTPSLPGNRDTVWCYTGLCTGNLGICSDLHHEKTVVMVIDFDSYWQRFFFVCLTFWAALAELFTEVLSSDAGTGRVTWLPWVVTWLVVVHVIGWAVWKTTVFVCLLICLFPPVVGCGRWGHRRPEALTFFQLDLTAVCGPQAVFSLLLPGRRVLILSRCSGDDARLLHSELINLWDAQVCGFIPLLHRCLSCITAPQLTCLQVFVVMRRAMAQ